MIQVKDIIIKNDNILESDMDEQLVMMNLENNAYFGLDKIGKEIWNLINKPTSIENLVQTLHKRHNITQEQCLTDIMPFLEKMSNKGLIEKK